MVTRMKRKEMIAAALLAFSGIAMTVPAAAGEDDTWGIYIYMCGSDLESQYGAATADLMEIAENTLPEGVTVVVQTGGATEWQNDFVDPERLERYVFQGDEGWCEDDQPLANMGDADTFADFLTFCHGNYPAEKECVILWDHGGGSVYGVAQDVLFDYDALTLDELYEGFGRVYGSDTDDPPLEMVGFDACLMATVDTANVLHGFSRYMIASEELEAGCGWNYEGWLKAVAEDPAISTEELGKVICDTYYAQCQEIGDYLESTLSVVDMTKLEPLLDAYNSLGSEALLQACADASFFASFGRGARSAENYGGNTVSSGFTNLVDLGDLAARNEELLPDETRAVQTALEDCVVYTINGNYRTQATGLSCYYSFNGDVDEYDSYTQISASEGFDAYYAYMLTGTLDEPGQAYLEELGFEGEAEELEELSSFGDEETDLPVTIDEDGYTTLTLDPETADMVSGISFELAYYDEEEDVMVYLGSDADITADWDNGVFKDNFRGVWGSIDGCICHMEVIYDSEEYLFYNVPILLNGEEYQLKVVYDYNDEAFHIVGANKGLDDTGMADRNTVHLVPGDKITTLHYVSSVLGDDEQQLMEMDELTVTEDTAFAEEDLGDGDFMLFFRIEDARAVSTYSEPAHLIVEDGEMTAELVEDM